MSSLNNRGFTLVEVLVAIAILASGLVLVVECMARSQQAVRVAENLVTSSLIAGEKLAEYQMEVRQSHTLLAGSESGEEKRPGRLFTWNKVAKPYSDPLIEDQTKINSASVTVAWKEGQRNNLLQMETLIMNREKKE